jgi:uncharacterized protein
MAMAQPIPVPVADLGEDTRGEFLVRVYQHLAAAIAAFVAFETLLFFTGAAERIYDIVYSSGATWLLLMGAFMAVSWISTSAAHDLSNPARQYGGLFGLAAGYSVIFAPFLYYVYNVEGTGGSASVASAAVVTALGFGGLTAIGLFTRKDLSFLRPLVMFGFVMSLVVIIAAVLFGLDLGVWFSLAMVALAGAAILYQTQAILRTYPETAYVGAAVQLFASVMTMFWYILRIFSRR